MNVHTYMLSTKDLYTFPTQDLETMAIHHGIPIGPRRDMVSALAKALHAQFAQMPKKKKLPKDTQVFRKTLLDKTELKLLDKLMNDLTNVLKKHKVRYWTDGGTALGTVRNMGILANTDDDVDLAVLEQDEHLLHKALKELDKKYDVDWDEETDPQCRRVMISAKTENGFPFAEFFIYKLEKGRTRFRCPDDEEDWGKKCFHEIKHLFPLRDYSYGTSTVQGANNAIPYLNSCYGDDWNAVAYRQQAHKGGFYYDDRRVEVTRFNPVDGINDKHVYDPDTRKWVKKGSAQHKKLIKKGYYTSKSKKPLYNLK